MSVMFIQQPDGTYEQVPVTPENTRRYIDSIPLYRDDVDDPTFWSWDRIHDLQDTMFKRQMGLVWEGSDYYKSLFKENGIEPGDITGIDDLEKIPLTYKKDYMADPEAFKLKPAEPTIYDWIFEVTYTTGSTTGVPGGAHPDGAGNGGRDAGEDPVRPDGRDLRPDGGAESVQGAGPQAEAGLNRLATGVLKGCRAGLSLS